ncbi:MAG: KUP/HAK/KT family potassium transporter, partial [Actinomycetota bacterium]|nr:KUP/HAK/KT family potassium transporter [Actinomycetota bacterium]
FFGANTLKIADGGWLPVTIAVVLFVVLTTWRRGRQLADASRDKAGGDLQEFVDGLHHENADVTRVPGCAVFLSRGEGHAPLALRANVKHNHLLHATTILLTIQTTSTPREHPGERISVDDLGFADDGISHVTARLGYLDDPSLPTLLTEALENGLEGSKDDIASASYFLSEPHLRITKAAGMAQWRKHLFVRTYQLTSDPVEFFDLPHNRTFVMGVETDI